jgi:hypothetical protein
VGWPLPTPTVTSRRKLCGGLAGRTGLLFIDHLWSQRPLYLHEDYPHDHGEPRHSLPFDENLHPEPAYQALHPAFACHRDGRRHRDDPVKRSSGGVIRVTDPEQAEEGGMGAALFSATCNAVDPGEPVAELKPRECLRELQSA